ncbi:Retrotransposon-derived protein PEG10 [Merluccius polli]|uniref:Retrotransposon-derived protein PEG10 n=1 Tax=Merluccius polli TaxID=89951 RepID=A0AA47MT33_MERPO|nr:Retrotransposon-derived protein PEG10 [Merluccius polli]
MDPANSTPPQNRLENIEQVLQHQDARFTGLQDEVGQALANQNHALAALTAQLGNLTAALAVPMAPSPAMTPPAPTSPPPMQLREPRVGIQEQYAGDPEGCSPYITNCSILFMLQPYTFTTEEAKVAYSTHLMGRAGLWGTAEWERRTPACSSFQAFASELQKVFSVPSRGPDLHGSLIGLRQGGRTVADYSIDFRTRVHRSEWNAATPSWWAWRTM